MTEPFAASAASFTGASVKVPPNVPPTLATAVVWPSLRSTSLKAITPLLFNEAIVTLVSSVMSPMASVSATLMVGPSLVPVTVTVTTWLTEPPWPSSILTVKVSVDC